jgi:UDP-N-acetylmuramoyl-tripeptide--D-alanyl-D-alanine ligase
MSREPLWTQAQIEMVLSCKASAAFPSVGGISIDTRSLEHGDLFVALKDARDGHDFVADAFAKGAGVALISAERAAQLSGLGPVLPVADPLKALERLGMARRAQSKARIIAVSGSVGKTGTKEGLRVMLKAFGPTHASVASYNNHLGVPLTLARMPLDAVFGVYEIGTNHAGEIAPLTAQVRPDIALLTTVENVHIENFSSPEAIADEKAALYGGVVEGGVVLLPRDNRHYARLRRHAEQTHAGHILTFGAEADADIRLLDARLFPDHTTVTASVCGQRIIYDFGAPGQHLVTNSLAMIACAHVLGLDLAQAGAALSQVRPPKGRGERLTLSGHGISFTLLDESYNANPASMRAALALLAQTPVGPKGRRIAVLGDMLELGAEAQALHQGLAGAIAEHGIDHVFAAGPLMRSLYEALPQSRQAGWQSGAEALFEPLFAALQTGDVVMVKGSFSSRMGEVIKALKDRYSEGAVMRSHS